MTVTAARIADMDRKRGRSVRMWDETWERIEDREGGTAASAFINDMTEAGLGFARCYRCFTPVPVEFGNLAGQPLAYWVEVAGKTVTRQSCKAHEPVTIGAGQDAGEPPAPRAGREAAAREKPATARTEPRSPAPGTAVFMEPVPHAEPVIASPVPEVPGRSKKGRRS